MPLIHASARAAAVLALALGAAACQPLDEDNPAPADPLADAAPAYDYGPLPDAAPDAFVGPATVALNEVDCRAVPRVEVYDTGGDGGTLGHLRLLDAKGHSQALEGAVRAGQYADFIVEFPVVCGLTRLALVDADGMELDAVVPALDVAANTFGRLPDGDGAFAPTAPTPGTANRAPLLPSPTLFGGQRVVAFDLTVPSDTEQLLVASSDVVLDASLRIDGGPPMAVGLKLTGRDGRWRPVELKPTFEIHFDHPDAAMTFEGQRMVVAHGAVLDPAVVGQHLGARLLAHAGLPAPATGFARLSLGGEPYGLYALVEPYDAVFAARHHASTWALYTDAGREITTAQVTRFSQVAGERSTRPVLAWLAGLLDDPPAEGFFAATADRVDWPEVWRAFATERWMQSGDGYAGAARAVTLHIEATDRITLWPDALDQIFEGSSRPFARRGQLFVRCLDDADCRAGYIQTFVEVARALEAAVPALDAELAELQDLLAEDVAADWRSQGSPEMFEAGVIRLRYLLGLRATRLTAETACLRANVDVDGDGWQCSADCDPNDAAVNPQAAEVCGDGVDNDCDGTVDVATECPACSPLVRGGRTYNLCTGALSWTNARAQCFARGRELARIESWGENVWLTIEARSRVYQDYWIGLNDREREGTFEWDDLSPLGETTFWGDGQPDDDGDTHEDCVHLRAGDARWNDLRCDTQLGYICEPRCDTPHDRDGDGFDDCGADCDDTDPAVNPAGTETCNNDADDDCDGIIDEGPDCDPCRTRVRGETTYLVCPQAVTFDAAEADCQARGASLVVVDDAAENSWLYATARRIQYQRYWIGLTHRERVGDWRWLDGRKPAFTAWTRGEPNHSGRAEKCGHLWEQVAGWNDIPCEVEQGYICELNPAD